MLRAEKEMEMRNMKLFLENQSIIRENEALKKKALLLHQEKMLSSLCFIHNSPLFHPPSSSDLHETCFFITFVSRLLY
ncbi:hypothetical protein DY000_02032067 [Brassica cretica]|uniref:Uncharacterized protein n=1 Tax=Brassica cretica TaxID=69181 RepID=A0ABQ7DJJ4_BRACR|nr:hypothetical protein DY000_02032067 [Brassica cretica]